MSSGSVLFQPFRSLGLISSHAHPHLKLLGQERFLTAALGKSWAVYNLDKLRVVLMGGAREQIIKSIVSFRDLTFTTCGSELLVWRRQEEVLRIRAHQSNVYLLHLFGSTLISVDDAQTMHVWDIKSLTPATSVRSLVSRTRGGESFVDQNGVKLEEEWQPTPLSTIQFPQTSRITSLLHPSTYLNKIVIGFGAPTGSTSTGAGGLELWNIKTRQRVYRFKTDSWHTDAHNPDRALDAALGRTKRNADGTPVQSSSDSVSVTCLEQSPAVDVIAVGLSNGLILLLNLQTDTLIHAYIHASPGSVARGAPIASISFRTDANQNFLATTAVNDGNICIWDLEKKQLKTVIKDAHGFGGSSSDALAIRSGTASTVSDLPPVTIHSIMFLPNEPLLITVGTDNALKQWIFDQADGTGRLLKERSGHSAPPKLIRFYPGGERGILDILSAGNDRSLRSFSLQKEEQSKELSQGSIEKRSKNFGADARLTQITDIAMSSQREKDWSNILTAHANDAAAYTWKWSNRALSQHKLLNTTPGAAASVVKSVAVSPCGNFALLGHANGRIDSYHMQSGTFKATYGVNHLPVSSSGAILDPNASLQNKDLASKNINLKRKAAKEAKTAAAASSAPVIPLNQGHTAAVTGLAVDGLNSQLISGGLDGQVIFWDFRRRNVLGRIQFDSPISKLCYSRENDLLAVMTDALVLHVVDANTHTVVRRFLQHRTPLTDITFSPDAKWLLTASTDCCVRVFDLPSSTMVDYLRFSKPVSSMSMSPRGDFLATTHVGNLAIHLWANKDYFGAAASSSTALLNDAWRTRSVARGVPLEMEIRERQDGMEDDVDEEETSVKQEDDEEDEDEDDASPSSSSNKRRKLSRHTSTAVTTAHTPLLDLSEEEQFSLITYSTVPKSKWQTLAHLEEIKQRNRATEPVQKTKDAPFFLTALTSLSNEKDGASAREKAALAEAFGVAPTPAAATPAVGGRTVRSAGATFTAGIIPLLQTAKQELVKLVKAQLITKQNGKILLIQAYGPVTSFLQGLSPAAIDGEIGSLGLDPTRESSEFELVLEYFLASLETQKNFEFTQAILNRFLKTHGTAIAQYPKLLTLCASINTVQQRTWGRLEESFHANLALVAHLAQIQL